MTYHHKLQFNSKDNWEYERPVSIAETVMGDSADFFVIESCALIKNL
jgi:hypothetical protein